MKKTWEQHVKSFEMVHCPKGVKFTYQCFGVSLCGEKVYYGQGYSQAEAFEKMIKRATPSPE